MWDRAWIRDAVVATTVRVGVRTPVALRMCPARRTLYAALRRVSSRRPACSSLRTNNPATAVSSCSANPFGFGRLESLNRLRVVGGFKPTTNDDGLCDHDSRRFFGGACERALRATSRKRLHWPQAAWRGWQDATAIDRKYAPRPPPSSTTVPLARGASRCDKRRRMRC